MNLIPGLHLRFFVYSDGHCSRGLCLKVANWRVLPFFRGKYVLLESRMLATWLLINHIRPAFMSQSRGKTSRTKIFDLEWFIKPTWAETVQNLQLRLIYYSRSVYNLFLNEKVIKRESQMLYFTFFLFKKELKLQFGIWII